MTARLLPFLAALTLLRVPGRGDVPSGPAALLGTRIASLTFRGDAPLETGPLAKLTGLGPGQMLTEPAIRTSLRNLFATRRFSDLSVEAAPSPDGTLVVVVYSAAPRIATMALVGEGVPDRGRLIDAIGLGPGDPWPSDGAATAERTLSRLLRERGFFEARAVTRVDAGPDDTSVDVRFDVKTGRPALAAAPEWSGSTAPFGTAELRRVAKLRERKTYREAKAREDAERYEALYHRKGFSRAEIRFDGERYDPAAGTVVPRYTVFVGPRVVLTVNGASRSEVTKHPESPWAREEPPDEESVRRLADALKRSLQEKGYARATVVPSFETVPGEERITVTVARADRWTIAHVGFKGVIALKQRALRGVMRTQPRGLLETGRLVDRDLASDREAITGLYRASGHPDARVTLVGVTEGAAPFTLDVTFAVEEGPLVLVGGRTVEGAAAIPREEIERHLTVVPGRRFDAAEVSSDANTIRSLYADRGFVEATVDSSGRVVAAQPGPPKAEVSYSILEGEPVTFGKTVVRGNRRTRFRIIERQFAHEEGKPFTLGRLVETQQNLSRLGVFQRVELTTFPTDPETRSQTVVVTVTEGRPWSLLYGVGAEYDANAEPRLNPRFSLGVSYNNLFGRALTVGVEGRYSRRDSRLVGTLRDRSFFDGRLPVALTVFRTQEVRPTFEVSRKGAFLEAERRLSPKVKTTWRYQYEIVKPDADPAILSTLERQNQQISISSFGLGATYDSRDDPIDPKRGFLVGTDFKYAFSFLDANARFLKGFAQAALYRPYEKTTIVLSVQAGAMESFGTCDRMANPSCPPNLEIPIVERFFAGGRSSHRAYSLDGLGIEGETLKNGSGFGGNGLLVGNVEWRIPLVGDFGLSAFFDIGNVWADYHEIRLGDLRKGLGLGVHYLTPFGPIRLEYGRKLDRQPGESLGAFSFSVGYPF